MNVLLTCAGRRGYLVEYFRAALDGRGLILAADMSAEAPALAIADRWFQVPSADHHAYLDVLVELCRANGVRLVVSLNDLELPVLSGARERFLEVGAVVAVPDPDIVQTCFDKWQTHHFLTRNGIGNPRTYLTINDATEALRSGRLGFPVVVKPRWGSASIGIEFAMDEQELRSVYDVLRRRMADSILRKVSLSDPDHSILIQECLAGTEYGLDVINDFSGRTAAVFVKEKLAMRAGETDRAVTRLRPELEAVGHMIGTKLGHIGNLDVDVFEKSGRISVLELNPRFGGGYPFSQMAGANVPAALLAWLEDRPVDPNWLTVAPDIASAKYDCLVNCVVAK